MARPKTGLPRRYAARMMVAFAATSLVVATGLGPLAKPARATGDASIVIGMASVAGFLTPAPTLSLASNVGVAYPGDEIDIAATLSYDEADLAVTGTLSAENDGDVTGTVEYVSVVWERRVTGQGDWTPFASFEEVRDGWTPIVPAPQYLDDITATASGIPAAGVSYPMATTPIVGTSIGASDQASWELTVSLNATLDSLPPLLDAQEYDGIRQLAHLEVSPRDSMLGQAFVVTSDVTGAVQTTDSDLSDGVVTVVLPDESEMIFDSASTATLGEFSIGDSPILVEAPFELPGTTNKGVSESVDDYLERLESYETLLASASFEADTYTGSVAANDNVRITQPLPILDAVERGDEGIQGGNSYLTLIHLTNRGSSDALALDVTSTFDSIEGATTGPTSVDVGAAEDLSVEYVVPDTFPEGTVQTVVQIAWEDAESNPYGPISAGLPVWVINGAAGAPDVGLQSHYTGIAAFGDETITASASDEETSVDSVELIIDGLVVTNDAIEPFEFAWDTTAEDPGPHALQVRATDSESNVATSAPSHVIVDNELASSDRVLVDASAGRISSDDAALYGVYALSGRNLLPARYASTSEVPRDVTGDFWQLLAGWEGLDSTTLDTIADHLAHQFDDMSDYYTPDLDEISGFATWCSLSAPCQRTTGHFRIEYTLNPMEDRFAAIDVLDNNLSVCSSVDPNLGECNQIPDYIDELAAGLESGWNAYVVELGYDPPVTGPNRVPVVVTSAVPKCSGFVGNDGPIQMSHKDCGAAVHLGRHEFFHWIQRSGFNNDPWATLGMLTGSCVGRDCTSFLWWNEASAEWATHQARELAPVAGDTSGTEYATNAKNFLRYPETTLEADNGSHEYGAFMLAEYLEEQFPSSGDPGAYCLTAPEPEACAIDPQPDIMKEIWEEIWTGHRPLEAIETVVTDGESTMSVVLRGFTRANYLLDAKVDGHRVAGSYVDDDAAVWREKLDEYPETLGDNPGSKLDNRPGHRSRTLLANAGQFDTHETVWIDPGGASYVEFSLPVDGSLYGLSVVAAGSDAPLAADALAFAGYPVQCAELQLEVTVTTSTKAEGRFLLPDECDVVTVMISHTDPLSWDGLEAVVSIWPIEVVDPFEKSSNSGWGLSNIGLPWRATGAAGNGSVIDGHARLGDSGQSGQRMLLWSGLQAILIEAHFTDCTDADSSLLLEFGTFVAIGSDGTLTTLNGGSPSTIPDFNPCKPFLVRATWDAGDLSLAVWQATQTEPASTTFHPTGFNASNVIRIHAIGIDSGDGVLFDAIDFTTFGVG